MLKREVENPIIDSLRGELISHGKIHEHEPAEKIKDAFLSPYYGRIIENPLANIRPNDAAYSP